MLALLGWFNTTAVRGDLGLAVYRRQVLEGSMLYNVSNGWFVQYLGSLHYSQGDLILAFNRDVIQHSIQYNQYSVFVFFIRN